MIRKTLTTLIKRGIAKGLARDQRTRLRAFPELRLCSSDEEVKRISLAANRRLMRNWRIWIASWDTGFVILWAVKVLKELELRPSTVIEALLLATAMFVGVILIPWGLVFIYARRMVHRYVREEMSSSGIPICIKCCYDLRTSKDRCPECGEEI